MGGEVERCVWMKHSEEGTITECGGWHSVNKPSWKSLVICPYCGRKILVRRAAKAERKETNDG